MILCAILLSVVINFRYVNGVAWNEPTRYRLGPSFYFFKNNFYSDEYPVINAVFETHLQKIKAPTDDFGFSASSEVFPKMTGQTLSCERSHLMFCWHKIPGEIH